MSEEYVNVESLKELKERIGDFAYFKFEEFKFEQVGVSDEYYLFYEDNHIETISVDIMSIEDIEEIIDDIRECEPDSMNEWLNS